MTKRYDFVAGASPPYMRECADGQFVSHVDFLKETNRFPVAIKHLLRKGFIPPSMRAAARLVCKQIAKLVEDGKSQ